MRSLVQAVLIDLCGCGQIAYDKLSSDAGEADDSSVRSDARVDARVAAAVCGDDNVEGDEICDPPGSACSADCL